MTGRLWHLLDDTSMNAIADAAMRLLTRTGVRIEHEQTLERLEAAGCRVDAGAHRCFFRESLIHDALAGFGSRPGEDASVPKHWHSRMRLSHGGSNPHLLEWPACRRRLATEDDVRDMAKMAHVLDEFESLGQVLTCASIPPAVEPVWNAVTRMRITDKPLAGGEVLFPQTIAHLAELGTILSGKKDLRLIASCDFCVAPLHWGRRAVECMIEKSRLGVTHHPGTMPISGISAPMTVAGTAVVAVAELLSGLAIYWLLDPKLPAYGTVASGSMDARSGHACFGSPEAILQDLATMEVCRRRFGVRVGMAANYVDCKVPGIRAVYEKMLPLAIAPVSGLGALLADGLLSAGQDYSPVQHLLELEMYRGIGRLYEPLKADAAALAEDLIDQVARTPGGTFANTDHTLEHFREQWMPRWLDRSSWQGEPQERQREHKMLAAIDDYCRSAVARYEPPKLDEAKLGAARELLERASRELAGLGQRA